MSVEFCKHFSVELCRENPHKIYVFGDNLVKRGKGGQAIIRDEHNAFGIPTKRAPSMHVGSFFSDKPEEAYAVRDAIFELYHKQHRQNGRPRIVVFPADGLGTGMAQLQTRSPRVWEYMQYLLNCYFFKPEA